MLPLILICCISRFPGACLEIVRIVRLIARAVPSGRRLQLPRHPLGLVAEPEVHAGGLGRWGDYVVSGPVEAAVFEEPHCVVEI